VTTLRVAATAAGINGGMESATAIFYGESSATGDRSARQRWPRPGHMDTDAGGIHGQINTYCIDR
jgi:hypothetical protein